MKQGLTLLFGMPRSGTTWIGKIFDSHPDTLYRHEPDSGGTLNGIPLFADAEQWKNHRDTVQQFISGLPAMNSIRVAGSLPIFSKSYLSSSRFLLRRLAVLATRAAETVARELPVPEFANYDPSHPPHIVWKSIESIGRLGCIARAAPESRGILILRHPCAYVASVLNGESQRRFSDLDPASEDYEILEWLLAALPHTSDNPSLETMKQLHPVERLAWRWVLSNEKALNDIAGAGNCTHIRYEDICAEPYAKTREMLKFAGLTWQIQVSHFVKQSTSHHSERYYSVFKDPAVSAAKWQTQLSPETIERIMKIVRASRLGDLYGDQPVARKKSYATGTKTQSISGAEMRDAYLAKGRPLPPWFTRPEAAAILAETYPCKHKQGFCIWFTGLSGAGKSTIADALTALLMERGRQVTVLDGDVVRTHLSKGLGFSREDRDTNVRRIGFVAAEVVRHGGAVICAAVSPYQTTRDEVRAMIGHGQFILVFVDTPLEECERRDPKGMYARARQGAVKNFTGLDDPYEWPTDADLVLSTMHRSPMGNALEILVELTGRGFVSETHEEPETINAHEHMETEDPPGRNLAID